jgi:hypothetical protein
VLDPDDRCPSEPEDCDGMLDEDGCPDRDDDQDSILDGCDVCPMEMESWNGLDDDDGCDDLLDRDLALALFRWWPEVHFPLGSAKIQPEHRRTLDRWAKTLSEHPEVGRVGVLAHARSEEEGGETLGQARAEAVARELLARGVAPGRLEAHGWIEDDMLFLGELTRAARLVLIEWNGEKLLGRDGQQFLDSAEPEGPPVCPGGRTAPEPVPGRPCAPRSPPSPDPGATSCAPGWACVTPARSPIEACERSLRVLFPEEEAAAALGCQIVSGAPVTREEGVLRGAALVVPEIAVFEWPYLLVLATEEGWRFVGRLCTTHRGNLGGDTLSRLELSFEDLVPGGGEEVVLETLDEFQCERCDGVNDVILWSTALAGLEGSRPYLVPQIPHRLIRTYLYFIDRGTTVLPPASGYELDVALPGDGTVRISRRTGSVPAEVRGILGTRGIEELARAQPRFERDPGDEPRSCQPF